VLGGSQGARSLNQLVAPALSQVKLPLSIVHQVGKGNLAELRQRYAELRRPGASVIEFIDDMPSAIAAADLVVSRAGAGAIAELSAVGRPSILVPLPHSGNHQLHNAQAVEKAGAALCLPTSEASVEQLCALVTELAGDPKRLALMSERALAWGRPEAAERVARDLLALAGLTPEEAPRQGAALEPTPSMGAAVPEGKGI
jgi:UDP-N-acetylglucosamine--N-acetylmuramyl-(pentapeptide) pyrophosphoryl-undecaprenol N-acetylglucosamine transferase